MKYLSALTIGLIAFVAQADQILENQEKDMAENFLSGQAAYDIVGLHEARNLDDQYDLDLLSKAEIARGMTTSEHY